MAKTENQKTKEIYSNLFKKNKNSYLSLNWGSIESQELRFKILTEIANLDSKSILDVGCGLGDFYNWLKRNKYNLDYFGVDITPEFIRTAEKEYGKDLFICEDFISSDFFQKEGYDYIFSSGIFATYIENPLDTYHKYITKMWNIAKRGVAFNSLSDWSENKEKNEYYADPYEIINICRTLTEKIVFKHDYHPRDFTIFLYK